MSRQSFILEDLNSSRFNYTILEFTIDDIKGEFLGKDSYSNSDEYKKELDRLHKFIKLCDTLYSRYSDNKKALDSISKPKPRSEWTEEDEYNSILGDRPVVYDNPEKGEQLKSLNEKIRSQLSVAEHERTVSQDKLAQMKKDARSIEKEMHKFTPFKKATKGDYEGFDITSTGVSLYDDRLKSGNCFIAEMPPKEYILRCAFQVFDNATIESTIGAVDFNKAKKYAERMRSGEKFYLPYLNVKAGQQEGRHRAIAAMMNGYSKIPVLIL